MGLFIRENCAICGKELLLGAATKIADNQKICQECFQKININEKFNARRVAISNANELKERIDYVKKDILSNKERIKKFRATTEISKYIWFDDNNNWFLIPTLVGIIQKCSIESSYVFSYDDIVGFELLEDDETITKGGLGSAVVGGALFGGIGAIVGATTGGKKTKGICNSLKIKITTYNQDYPTVYVNFINNSSYKRQSIEFRELYEKAQQCLSILQIIISKREFRNENVSKANMNSDKGINIDEIRKYKELLDMGVITKEEFDIKKNELLNL